MLAATDTAGLYARIVKRADLRDHLRTESPCPPLLRARYELALLALCAHDRLDVPTL
jgi:hypothetical protein